MADLKQIARRLTDELFGQGKLELVDQLCAPACVHNDPIGGKLDNKSVKDFIKSIRTAFPDLSIKSDKIYAEGNVVCVTWKATGTHRGEFVGVPGSGRKVQLEGLDLLRFDGDKLVDATTHFNTLWLMQQLGIVPKLEKAAGARPEQRPS